MRWFSLAMFLIVGFHSSGLADEPLPAPEVRVVKSQDGLIEAKSDPKKNLTTIRRARTKKKLWTIPGWYRDLTVSNDGRHVVTGYDGINLIPRGYDNDLVLFTFWSEGERVRGVTVKEFIPHPSILEETVSHYHWGSIQGIDQDNRLVVRRADGRKFRYALESGTRIP